MLARWSRGGGRRRRGSAPLSSKAAEILLPRLKRSGVSAGGPFRVHGKPHRPNYDFNDAGRDVLNDFRILLGGESFGPLIVGKNLSVDHGAVRISILRLNRRDRLRIAACTST